MKKTNLLLFILFLGLCSAPSNEGVTSLSGDTTTTSIIEEEDYPVVLTQCLNEEMGYNIATPFDIEDLKSNDKVLSFDLKNQKYGISVISEIKIYETKCTTSVITFDDGSIIESTTEHPYWVIDKGWSAVNPTAIEIDNKKLANLEKGDVCLKYDGQKVIYVKIKDIKLEIKETKVYNLLGVNPFNNYFANKILVHNK